MKRKADQQGQEAIKKRKQNVGGSSSTINWKTPGNTDPDEAAVQAMHSELDTFKSKERADLTSNASVLPHVTFAKKPKPRIKKPMASMSNSASLSSTILPPQIKDHSLSDKKKKDADGNRRTSLMLRSKRTSDSFGSGQPVTPHDSIASDRLYRHTDPDLPEPHRARHLLVWCARRAIPHNNTGLPKLSSRDSALLATVQGRIVKELLDSSIEIAFYGMREPKPTKSLAEDPTNVKNKARYERLLLQDEQARNEDTMWSKVVQDYNSLQSNVLSSLPVDSQTSRLDSADRLAPETDPKWRRVDEELDFFRMQNERGTDLDRELSKRCHLLPLKLDALRNSIKRSNAFTEQAADYIDQLFAKLDLRKQSEPSSTLYTGNSRTQKAQDLFKTLASNDMRRPAILFGEGLPNDGLVREEKRITTVVQPVTPRRMPGTPKKAAPEGSSIKRR